MERVMYINNLINNKNRILCRLPIYQKYIIGDRNYSTIKYSSSTSRSDLFLNHIICRQKSSNTESNTESKPAATRLTKKNTKILSLKTNVTNLTDSPHTQQHPLKLLSRNNLTQFVSDTVYSNLKTVNLNECPVLCVPKKIQSKIQTDSEIVEKSIKSLNKFIIANPQQETEHKIKLKKKSEPLDETSLELFRFDPVYQKKINEYKSITENLRCYVNACVNVNFVARAFSVLKSCREHNIVGKRKYNLIDSTLYFDLMAKYAELKKWQEVKDIYNILIADKLPITPQVYQYVFDCLGRMQKSDENMKIIAEYVKKAEKQGISLNDIMDKSTFIKDQRETVLSAIQRVHPSFAPVYTPPQLGYSNKLLDFMNENIQSIELKPNELINSENGSTVARPRSGFTADELSRYTAEQIKNEEQGYIMVKKVTSSKYLSDKVKMHREIFEKLTNKWQSDILLAFKSKLNILQHKMYRKPTKAINIYPYMLLLQPEEYADILMDEIKTLGEVGLSYSPTVGTLYEQIGEKVLNHYITKTRDQNGINEKLHSLYKTYREILCSGNCSDNPRQLWQRIIHHSRDSGPCVIQKPIDWPYNVKREIGFTLFKILLDDLKIDANLLDPKKTQAQYVPVIYSMFRTRNLINREEIRPHPVYARLFYESKLDEMRFNTNEVPMFCPPIPWTSPTSGGYLQSRADFLRLPYDFRLQNEIVNETPTDQLYPTLDACNQLGSIPWCVNTKILDLAIKVFNLGGDKKLDVPETPDDMVTDEHLQYRGITRTEFNRMRNEVENVQKYNQHQNEMLSLYSDTLYKLSLANHFRDRAFWLPTNLDFRGRTYPVPPHLTHLSADLSRAMMCFHEKRPLGENGLDWLKLHCINLTALKKRESIHDRLKYANEIIDDIIDSADNPLDGRQWWLNSDDPWQTLAACMEIANALRSPNPAEYMSGLPIHQDGSCNGLQHYAALGRDVDGAASVNLTPSEVPQDVYTTVANRVEELRQIDAEKGDQIAIDLDGLVKRKTVKQTIMTTVYGVTAFGAILQIKKQLKNSEFPSNQLMAASTYLTKKTFFVLSEMFESAREIQDWFTKSARYIAGKNRSQHVEWTTPLGLPIIQPYIKEKKPTKDTSIASAINSRVVVNSVKEKNAFSPNFIHSLDACHMMLTSLHCERAGLTFVSVHDCFWTHPSTATIMNRICRDQFILLHSQPILEDLADTFYQKYEIEYIAMRQVQKERNKRLNKKNGKKSIEYEKLVPKNQHIFFEIPEKGELDLNSIRDSIYFFS